MKFNSLQSLQHSNFSKKCRTKLCKSANKKIVSALQVTRKIQTITDRV